MVVLAFVVSYAVLDGACRVRAAHGPSRVAWLACGSLVVGLSIWAMHFVALLSLRSRLPMTEDPVTLGVAAVTAVVAAAGALYHVDRGAGGVPALAVSGALKGFALVATYYTMMAALHIPAAIAYEPLLVAGAAALAVAVSIATMSFAERLQAERPARAALERLVIAAAMAGGLVLMHEIARRSGHFVPDAGWQDEFRAAGGESHVLPQAWLAPWVTAAAIAGGGALAIAATLSRWRAHDRGTRPAGDGVTGLPNTAALRERLGAELDSSAACAVIVLRVDDLGAIRRRLGRRGAEDLVVRLGWRIAGAVRPGDQVGRLSRAEYAVVVGDLRAVGAVAESVRERLGAPVRSAGLLVVVPVAVGIAAARPRDTATSLLARAQHAARRDAPRAPLAGVARPSVAA
jgi:NO-binding membrane sensor protein with MHYT domain/GGDEF domain-containing protein